MCCIRLCRAVLQLTVAWRCVLSYCVVLCCAALCCVVRCCAAISRVTCAAACFDRQRRVVLKVLRSECDVNAELGL